MEIIKIIENALKIGCEIDLTNALKSKRFKELKNNFDSLFSQYPENTDQGIALQAGHFIMGQLLNTFTEDEALKKTKETSANIEFENAIELRPLIELLGEYIIEKAKECLSDDILQLANEWEKADATNQIEIIKNLFIILRSEDQGKSTDQLTLGKAIQDFFYEINKKNYGKSGYESFLPKLYGKWDKKNNIINCQGKTQLLIAFANLVKAKIMTIAPIIHGRTELHKSRDKFMEEELYPDLCRRKIDTEPEFMDSLSGFYYKLSANKIWDPTNDFHIGACIQIKDGRWVLIDPHGLSWGVFSDKWEMERIFQLLNKYKDVLPGLHFISNNQKEIREKLQKRIAEARELIKRSNEMEQLIKEKNITNIIELILLVESRDDLDILLRMHLGRNDDNLNKILANKDVRYIATMKLLSGTDNLEELINLSKNQNFFQKQIKKFFSFYHCVAINHLRDQLTDEGELLHPICEFSVNPHYNVAISIINSICVRDYKEEIYLDNFFINYSFNQVTLFNVMQSKEPKIKMATTKAVKNLPFKHENISRLLLNQP